MAPTPSQLAALSRLFSSAVFREMAKKGRSPTFARLCILADIDIPDDRQATVADGFDAAFDMLKRAGLRDEYVYRTAVTQKILMGRHSLSTACMLTEFRAGACKADLVILNGTATAYEIKSERDSLTRLNKQVTNYQKVFAAVNVIVSEAHVSAAFAAIPDEVGILCLSGRYRIQVLRHAENQPQKTCPVSVFESLRSSESIAVLKKIGVSIPRVPNTQMHAAMREIFSKQDPSAVHHAMVDTLKRTRSLFPVRRLMEQLPRSLHAAAVSIKVKHHEYDHLVKAVSTPIAHAMEWS